MILGVPGERACHHSGTAAGVGIGIGCGLIPVLHKLRSATARNSPAIPDVTNPTSLPVALGFGVLYAAILVLSAWFSQYAGEGGLLAVAAVSGLVDVDAITLSSLRLFDTGAVTANAAVVAIVVAFFMASLFKLIVITWLGGWGLARRTWLAVLAPVAGTAAALWLVS
jgi:uncharacterized membrane protein (DUF4010 family)